MDWRWEVAVAALRAASAGRPNAWNCIKDKEARALARHLQCRQTSPLKDGDRPTAFDRITAWRESETGMLVEAFLLAIDYETVANELDLPVEEVRLYGGLCFDLRDERGNVRPGVRMRLLAVLENQQEADIGARLKKVAITGGIHGLRQVLHTGVPPKTEPGLEALVEAELRRRLHAGELRTGDLVRMQANSLIKARLAMERGDQEQPSAQVHALIRHILELTAPRILGALEKSEEQTAVTTEQIHGRLQSQKRISAVPLIDAGEEHGLAALNQKIQAQFGARED